MGEVEMEGGGWRWRVEREREGRSCTEGVGVCDTDGRCYRSGLSYERVVEDVQQIHDAFFLSDGNAQYF